MGTFGTTTNDIRPDDLHYTIDIKTPRLIQRRMHLTLHAYLGENPINRSAVSRILCKVKKCKIAFEDDKYFDPQKNIFINNWDKVRNGLDEHDEPGDLMCWWPGGNHMVLLPPKVARSKWEDFLGGPLEKTIEGLEQSWN